MSSRHPAFGPQILVIFFMFIGHQGGNLSRCLVSPPQSVLEQLASSGNQHLVPAVDGILDTAKELTEASESRRGHLAPRGNETKAKKNK